MKPIQSKNLTKIFWGIGILSFAFRAFLNFSQELLMGNGGYYPLQVRAFLERGELAFPDMPFLFSLNAGIIKTLDFIGFTVTNDLIINVVKFVDSISIPLLLIPLYHILKLTKNKEYPLFILTTTLVTVMSFFTLNLTSSFQKNALGITIIFFAFAWLYKFLKTEKKSALIIGALLSTLIALTHFGSFAFALLCVTVFLIFRYKKKAIIPIVSLIIAGLILIYFFDPVRSERLLLAWQSLFSRLPRPSQLVLSLVYFSIAYFAYRGYKKHRVEFDSTDQALVLTSLTVLILISIPALDPQTADRLYGFLFIPVVLLIFLFGPYFTIRNKKIVAILTSLLVIGSVGFMAIMSPPSQIDKSDLDDLNKMKFLIRNPVNTVIVSRHNLEFWVAWALSVDVSQESKFDETLIQDYEDIYIINQVRNEEPRMNNRPEAENQLRSHFSEPLIPENSTLIYSSDKFKLYRYNRD